MWITQFKFPNSSQAHFLKRLSQAVEPRMSEKSTDFYATVQKVVPRKSLGISIQLYRGDSSIILALWLKLRAKAYKTLERRFK